MAESLLDRIHAFLEVTQDTEDGQEPLTLTELVRAAVELLLEVVEPYAPPVDVDPLASPAVTGAAFSFSVPQLLRDAAAEIEMLSRLNLADRTTLIPALLRSHAARLEERERQMVLPAEIVSQPTTWQRVTTDVKRRLSYPLWKLGHALADRGRMWSDDYDTDDLEPF